MVVDDRLGDVDRFVSTVLEWSRDISSLRGSARTGVNGAHLACVLIPGRRREGAPEEAAVSRVVQPRGPETADAEEDDDDQRRAEEVVWSKVLPERRAVPGRIVT
jgi:hypothetical protein